MVNRVTSKEYYLAHREQRVEASRISLEVMTVCHICHGKAHYPMKNVGSVSCRECILKYGKDKQILWYCPEGKTPESCGKAKDSGVEPENKKKET